MRLARVRAGEREGAALVVAGHAVLLQGIATLPPLLSNDAVMARLRGLAARFEELAAADPSLLRDDDGLVLPLDEVEVLAPIARPGKIVALGWNYRAHAAEHAVAPGEFPAVFLKAPTSVIGPGEAIRIPPESAQVEHEVELAVVIGRRVYRPRPEEALASVGGYTILNDVTARDWQRRDRERGQPFDLAKGFDTFCPLGPWVVTPDDLGDVGRATIELRVNGGVRQRATVGDLVVGVPEILSYLSAVMTLEPGDVIATGTPEGVGPLHPGDLVEAEIAGIGILRNPVASA